MDILSYLALGLLVFAILSLAYGLIAIHDIPYLIAKKRGHPHQDAIHSGGWVSLFTLHAIWPFLWIWASAYHPEHGYGGRPAKAAEAPNDGMPLSPEARIAELEARLQKLENPTGPSAS